MATTPTLSSAGIGSGLDVNSLVSKLMSVEQRPLTLLQTQAKTLQTQLSAFGKVQSLFSDMRDKAQAAMSPTLWGKTTATSSNEKAVTATTDDGGTPANYDIQVSQLAAAQMVATPPLPGSGATLSEGQIHIQIGKWIDTPAPQFDPKAGGSTVDITIGKNETTLGAVRDKINAAGAGVTATIVNDSGGARLMLRSSTTGEESAFRITTTEANDDGDPNTGLSMLQYDAHGASVATRIQDARNAQFSVNGMSLSSATNQANGVVSGLNLKFNSVTASGETVNVGVARDDTAVKKAVTDFVTSYNAAASYLRTATAYNADSKVAGDLQGDAGAVALINQMRGVINTPSSASSKYGALSSVGISMQSDGTLKVDDTKLTAALANPTELRKVLAADDSTTGGSGFVTRFKRLADAALGVDGAFAARTTSLKSRQTANSKAQSSMQDRLDATEARLRSQYQALDSKMASMSTLSQYVARQFGNA